MGDKYSVPYMSTGLGVLVMGYIPMTRESVTEWKNASYLVVLSMFNVAILKVLSGPSQTIIIAFLFYNLIIMSTYTASLAVVLGQVTNSYSLTIDTLCDATIGTYPTYQLRLQKQYALSSVITYDSTDQGNMLAAMADMKAGLISGFIYDMVPLQFNLPQLDNLLPTTIEPFSYTVLTHRLFNQTMLDAFNGNIVVTQESDIVENLIAKYVPAFASCNVQSNGVDIQQIDGLYIILAAIVGAAILLWTVIKISLHIRAVISDFNYQQSFGASLEGGPESSSKMSVKDALKTVFTKSSLKGSLSMDVSTKRGLSFAASSKGANNGGFLLSGSLSGNKVTPFNGSGGGSLSRDLGEDDKEVSYMKPVAVSSPYSAPSKKVNKQQLISVTSNSQIKGGNLVDIHKQNGAAAYIAAAGVNPYADNAAAAAAEGTIQFLTTTSEIDDSSNNSSEISTQSGSRLDGKGAVTSATLTPVLIMEPAKTMDLVDA
ncbi:hypothetical protein CEUSTIGMA_g5543.t1 [Chlamydomonas eustigma]|uniref:Ionotropic glutamate receptor C-terminal domain-containing protein n=1 Tax=Chlamydomonas eustigma TaxID=1157962 RepID=A0A250X4V6_9CHLO|nr:hypothetical protein CEUSTIGMA_g5543.t1 [Chlamydomonas eustigma]|eukprot:GAX78101.1 hypothetical protein CEUSTIGMA_g5543.t1 [Chlamydomonas eustigma]